MLLYCFCCIFSYFFCNNSNFCFSFSIDSNADIIVSDILLLFFDRFSSFFPYILDYLRYGKICLKKFKKLELEELAIEAEYYEVNINLFNLSFPI
jgi:hypothetical protein